MRAQREGVKHARTQRERERVKHARTHTAHVHLQFPVRSLLWEHENFPGQYDRVNGLEVEKDTVLACKKSGSGVQAEGIVNQTQVTGLQRGYKDKPGTHGITQAPRQAGRTGADTDRYARKHTSAISRCVVKRVV